MQSAVERHDHNLAILDLHDAVLLLSATDAYANWSLVTGSEVSIATYIIMLISCSHTTPAL